LPRKRSKNPRPFCCPTELVNSSSEIPATPLPRLTYYCRGPVGQPDRARGQRS
jgi:hypothetical protein